MIPILFEHDALTDVNTNGYIDTSIPAIGHGLGDLVESAECVVRQTDENIYELELKYPANGKLVSELKINRLIVAKPNPRDNNQIFRIYGYEKEIDQFITIKAQHISYDLNDVFFFPYWGLYYPSDYLAKDIHPSYSSPASVIVDLKRTEYYLTPNRFAFNGSYGNRTYPYRTYMSIDKPTSVRSVFSTLMDTFGGICTYDNYRVYYTTNNLPVGGKDSRVYIEYGKDLIDLNQEENISEMVTGIIPYFKGKDRSKDGISDWRGPDSVVIGDIQYISGTVDRHKIIPVDVTSKFAESRVLDLDIWGNVSPQNDWIPLKSCVDNVGKDLIKNGNYGVPEVNITLDSTQINGDIRLYDFVIVRFFKLGIDVKARVSSTTYDVLSERLTKIEIGKSRDRLLTERWDMEYRKY